MPTSYQIRLCRNPACGLRYPLTDDHPFGERCPACLGETDVVLSQVLNPEVLPRNFNGESKVYALLDNIRSAWNVGAIFRTADGLGVSKLFLCGITPTPENAQVRKTALGAEQSITWDYARNSLQKAGGLKTEGYQLWAVEQDPRAIPAEVMNETTPGSKIVLILGNEVTGVDPHLLDLCDRIIDIPMRGRKKSLNVEVAFGIAAYTVLSQSTRH